MTTALHKHSQVDCPRLKIKVDTFYCENSCDFLEDQDDLCLYCSYQSSVTNPKVK